MSLFSCFDIIKALERAFFALSDAERTILFTETSSAGRAFFSDILLLALGTSGASWAGSSMGLEGDLFLPEIPTAGSLLAVPRVDLLVSSILRFFLGRKLDEPFVLLGARSEEATEVFWGVDSVFESEAVAAAVFFAACLALNFSRFSLRRACWAF